MREIQIYRLLISRRGEQQFFQVNIPRDVQQISGIATSVQLIDVPSVPGAGQVGRLQLQATGKMNLCFNSLVKLEPAEGIPLDLGLLYHLAGFPTPNALQVDGLAQRGKTTAEKIVLPYCNSFYANYKDMLGAALQTDVRYAVTITLWKEFKKAGK